MPGAQGPRQAGPLRNKFTPSGREVPAQVGERATETSEVAVSGLQAPQPVGISVPVPGTGTQRGGWTQRGPQPPSLGSAERIRIEDGAEELQAERRPPQDRNTGSGPQPSATPAWSTGQQQQPRQELPRPGPGRRGQDLSLNETSGQSRTWSRSRSPGPGHFSPSSADPGTSQEAAAGDGRGRGSGGRRRWGMLAVTALQEGSAWGETMPAGKHLCMVPSPRNNCLGLEALLTPFCG